MSNKAKDSVQQPTKDRPQTTAIDPASPNMIQPYKSLVGLGYITELRITFTPGGVSVFGKPDARLANGTGIVAGADCTASALLDAAHKLNLVGSKKDKKEKERSAAPKPVKYLVPDDFDLKPEEFDSRAKGVTLALGAGVIGRAKTFKIWKTGFQKFSNFWDSLSADDRIALYCKPDKLAQIKAKPSYSEYKGRIFLEDETGDIDLYLGDQAAQEGDDTGETEGPAAGAAAQTVVART